jgi:hypothetical protein
LAAAAVRRGETERGEHAVARGREGKKRSHSGNQDQHRNKLLHGDLLAIGAFARRGKTEGTEHVVSSLGKAEQASADNNRQQNCEHDIPFHDALP